MASHSATLLDAVRAGDEWKVRAKLRCGCEVVVVVPFDRIVEAVDGARILVGKYRCPQDHPPRV